MFLHSGNLLSADPHSRVPERAKTQALPAGLVVHVYNPSTRQGQGQGQVEHKVQASLGYLTLSQKNNQTNFKNHCVRGVTA
jgi:hypothetical protein